MNRLLLLFFGLIAALVLVFLIGLSSGTVPIVLGDWFHLTETQRVILIHLRLSRLLTALLVGGCLAAAGAAFQGVLQNPLADPYVLGVSAGAGLGATAAIVFGLVFLHPFWVPASAFLGALATIYLVYLLVRFTRKITPTQFILVGIMVNAFFSSIMMGLLFLGQQQLTGVMAWLMGDLTRMSLTNLAVLFPIAGVILMLLIWDAYPLTILCLGDSYAASVGISVSKLRRRVFIYASLLTGLAVSCGGIIGFIGLVIPHFLRLLIRDDFRILIPASFILGGIFLMAADTVARSILPPLEIPVGIFASLIGGPFFIFLLIRSYRKTS